MSPWRTLSVTRSKSAWHLLSRSANHLWVTRLIPATPSLLPLPCCCSPRGAGPFQTVRAPQCLLWEDQVDGECHVPAAGGVDGGVQGRDGGGAQAGDGEEGRSAVVSEAERGWVADLMRVGEMDTERAQQRKILEVGSVSYICSVEKRTQRTSPQVMSAAASTLELRAPLRALILRT